MSNLGPLLNDSDKERLKLSLQELGAILEALPIDRNLGSKELTLLGNWVFLHDSFYEKHGLADFSFLITRLIGCSALTFDHKQFFLNIQREMLSYFSGNEFKST